MPVIETINAETLQHAPTALATIIAVENAIADAPGETKAQIVVNSVVAGAQAAGHSPNVTVASVSALTALFVSILNASGLFKRRAKPAGV